MRGVATETLFILANLNEQSGAYADALQNAAKTLGYAQAAGDEELQALALGVTATVYADQQKYADAEPVFDQSITHLEKWRAAAGSDTFRTSLDDLLLLPFEDALSEAYESKHLQRAFEIEEEMKAKLLVERIQARKDGSGSGGGFSDQELSLRRELEGLEADRIAKWNSDAAPAQIVDISTKITNKRQEYEQLIQDISLNQPLRAVALDNGRPSLSVLQQSIPSETAVVDYAFIQDSLVIFVVTRTTFDYKTVSVKRDDVKAQMETVRSFADPKPTQRSDLYNELIGPVRSLIHAKHLVIVPDGPIRDMPFSALYDGTAYLGERFAIASVATAKVLRTGAAAVDPATSTYLLASYSSPDGLEVLSHANAEVKDIANILGTSAITDESRQSFLASASAATIIHIAAHALPDTDQASLSRLYLKPDHDNGSLTVFDVAGMTLPKTRLVVLSACDSNVSTVNRLDEAVGFPESFMEAGTPTIVSSLWLVNDGTSEDLMKYFYAALQQGERVDQALADAQAKIRTTKPDPFEWAGYVVVGDGGKVF
jgi:CHAT domain-containing protein